MNSDRNTATDSSQKPEPVIEEPKKLSSVYDRLYANSKPKVRKRIEENPKKVEKPKKKPVKKERSFNVDHKVISVTPGLHVENEKEAKPRVSVYDRLYKTTTESRRAQQKVTLPQQIISDRKSKHNDVVDVQETLKVEQENEKENAEEEEIKVEVQRSESDSDLDDSDTIDFTKFKRNRPKTARDLQRIIVKSVKKQGAFRRLHKVPAPLIERESTIQAAVPILPKFLARIFLIMNAVVPGTGTISAGFSNLCCGAPRFTLEPTNDHRLQAFFISLAVGISQLVTVLFCLVGWCWSIGWGIIMVTTAESYETLTKDEPHKLSIAPIVTVTIEEPDKEFTQTNENI
ncbi:uncharacterized protein LOC136029041 [Artemia franciscana]|uniref:uncharacterized protein LOC136029041 n=1 Tax=Artemia franciscana TaxID=6661 RepID=UPI0032DACFA5